MIHADRADAEREVIARVPLDRRALFIIRA